MQLLLFSVFLVGVSYAHRYGSPIGACTQMFPVLHGVDARTDDPPFTITVSKNTYTGGESIEVFVDAADKDPDDGTSDWFMEGILIMARKAKTASVDCPTVPVGTWEVPKCDDFVMVIDCFPKQYDKSAVTHYKHTHSYNTTLTWKAPDEPVGHVYIVATIARNKERFWVNVQSEIIKDVTDTATVDARCPKQQHKYVDPYITVKDTAAYTHVEVICIVLALIGLFSI